MLRMKAKSRTYNWSDRCMMVIYCVLACGMYYFNNEYLSLGINFMYKFILAGILAVLSFLIFLIRTDLVRGRQLLRYIVLLSLPNLITIMASVPLWVFQVQKLTQIRRGVFDQIYQLATIIAVAGILYVFGKRGLWLNLAAMLGANFITVVQVIYENGFSAYLQELRMLIVTFSKETGPLMQQMEIHEVTFAMGIYLVYYVLKWKECRRNKLLMLFFGLTLFCFLSGFKRIGVAAIAAALLVWLIMRVLTRKRNGLFWLLAASFVGVGVAFLYIVMVKYGIFEYLSARFGLDTMGRRELSRFIDQYYWIGADFLGNGAGFVTRMFSDLPAEYTIRALHNDVLMLYIDIGFWGFLVWMLCYFPLRVSAIYRQQGVKDGILCLCLQVYILITAMTDNTIYYTYVTGALAICLMSRGLTEREVEYA